MLVLQRQRQLTPLALSTKTEERTIISLIQIDGLDELLQTKTQQRERDVLPAIRQTHDAEQCGERDTLENGLINTRTHESKEMCIQQTASVVHDVYMTFILLFSLLATVL